MEGLIILGISISIFLLLLVYRVGVKKVEVRKENVIWQKVRAEKAMKGIQEILATFEENHLDEKLIKFAPILEKVRTDITEIFIEIEKYHDAAVDEILAIGDKGSRWVINVKKKPVAPLSTEVKEKIDMFLSREVVFVGTSVPKLGFSSVVTECEKMEARMQYYMQRISGIKSRFVSDKDVFGTHLCTLIEEEVFPEYEACVRLGIINQAIYEEKRSKSFVTGMVKYVSMKRNTSPPTPQVLNTLVRSTKFVENPEAWARQALSVEHGF